MFFTWALWTLLLPAVSSILPKQANEIREIHSLNGLWTFVREETNGGDVGLANKWNTLSLGEFKNSTKMPVPSAYNDLGDIALRDHVGWVWYEKKEVIPLRAKDNRIYLRLDSANYYSVIFVNSQELARHEGGHIPIEVEITDVALPGQVNIFTVAINNTVSAHTIPQGEFQYVNRKRYVLNTTEETVTRYPPGYFTTTMNFDFFNYAGLLRPVNLLFRPKTFVDDFVVNGDHMGNLNYSFSLNGEGEFTPRVTILDPKGVEVYRSTDSNITVLTKIKNVEPWWPRGMGLPNLYTFTVELLDNSSTVVDVFRTKFGFRSVDFDSRRIYFNKKPFYCMGMGWHEESAIRGRSFDYAVMMKDFSLFEWMGANCFRTSHYPYAEETMDEADRRGFAVIVEVQAVGLQQFSSTKGHAVHAKLLHEMIARDRNHPSVFMWSVANEPFVHKNGSREYFKDLIELVRSLDPTRLVTVVHGFAGQFNQIGMSDLVDVMCVNRYYGWYIDMGQLDQIAGSVYFEFRNWVENFKKPFIFTEYGAETIPGLLTDPPMAFSSQYTKEVYLRTFDGIDRLRKKGYLSGESAWVFADFMTQMSTTRILGNHKGLFTRDRQPKEIAYMLRDRYHHLASADAEEGLSPANSTEH